MLRAVLTDNCCRASARQLTNLDIPVSYEISESRASLSPELYIVEISICVCGFVEMTGFRGTGFFFSTNTGENVTNSAGRLRTHFAFHVRVATWTTETRLFFMFVRGKFK